MPYRYFYSTEESDTALKAIIEAYTKDYVKRDGLMKGVFEYKLWMEKDAEFLNLGEKIEQQGIRASASPDKMNQFGNILPTDYLDTTQYAAGCTKRATDTLQAMIAMISGFKTGLTIAQRDLDMFGSASLGTVAITLSSLYTKTYNVPINGTVSDRTLIRATTDATTPTQTQTNATCNSAMFDFPDFHESPYTIISTDVVENGQPAPTIAEWTAVCKDYKPNPKEHGSYGNIVFDFSVSAARKASFLLDCTLPNTADNYITISGSNDNVTYTVLSTIPQNTNQAYRLQQATGTFRYIKFHSNQVAQWSSFDLREVWAWNI